MKSRSLQLTYTVLTQYIIIIHTIPTVYYVGHIAIKTLVPLDSTNQPLITKGPEVPSLWNWSWSFG